MIYLYGLCDTRPNDAQLAALEGVTGPVFASETQCGWLIHGPSDGTELLPKRRHMLSHTRVLEVLGETRTILPMRFGMMAESVAEFSGLVAENNVEIAKSFARLTGQVELGLRVQFPREAALEATLREDGELAKTHAYLTNLTPAPHFEAAAFGRRLAEALDARRAATQDRLLQNLRPLLTDYRIKAPESDVQVLTLDVLLPAEQQAALANTLALCAAELSGFANGAEPLIRIIGPVPAYGFVDLSLVPEKAA